MAPDRVERFVEKLMVLVALLIEKLVAMSSRSPGTIASRVGSRSG
jgi:hypothetical protein